jgi:Ras-related protein Rab-6A
MYDVNSRQSFEECAKFADIVRTHKGNAPIVVTGNKLDIALENRMVLMQDGEDFAKKYNAKFFEISAMLKTNTDKVLDQIVTEVQAIRNPPAVKSKKCSVM